MKATGLEHAQSFVVATAYLMLIGCATHPSTVEPNLLEFLDSPAVARSDVYNRLGAPHGTYEHNAIAAFRVGQTLDGYYVATPALGWKDVRYSLLVEFDGNDIVAGHYLVQVREP